MIKVLLKDGTFLDCVIFNEDGRAIGNLKEIHERFSKEFKPIENFKEDMIHFQTDYINGHFHPANVKWYTIE
jgi:hypothetical protein